MRAHYKSKKQPIYQKYYKARNITVCSRWTGQSGFINFLEDMGERPEGYTLDRIDNDGNYEPSNCRWATKKEQSRNREGFNRMLTHNGETKCVSEWSESTGIPVKTLFERVYRGWTVDQALNRSNHYKDKLDFDTAQKIRRSKLKSSEIAKVYGVSSRTIRDVRNNITWKEESYVR